MPMYGPNEAARQQDLPDDAQSKLREKLGEPDEVLELSEWLDPDLRPDQMGEQLGEPVAQPSPPPDARPLARKGMKTHRTGPKGVVADYNEAKLKMRALRIRDKISLGKKICRASFGAAAPLRAAQPEESDEDSEDYDEHDEVIAKYKRDRIRMAHEELPKFGAVTDLKAKNFLKEIDGEPPCVTIVIHVYQDYLEPCARMNEALDNIAAFFPFVKFMRGRTDHILPDYPDHACPTFIVFKGGQQIHNLVCVLAEIGYPFKDAAVVAYLRQFGVLPLDKPTIPGSAAVAGGESGEEEKESSSVPQRMSRGTVGRDEDSDDSELDL